MPEIPAGAKQPTDHLPTSEELAEVQANSDEILADLPSCVRPPHKLRIRQRNKALELMFEFSGVQDLFEEEDYSELTLDDLILEAKNRGLDVNAVEYDEGTTLTVEELKNALAAADTDTSGHKADLAARYALLQRRAAFEALLKDSDSGLDVEKDGDLLKKLLDLAARVDEWVETDLVSEADRETYVEWAEGKDHNVFIALLSRYAKFSGE